MNGQRDYFIQCQFRSGRSWVERDIARTDWQSTVEDIASGEVKDVVEVREAWTGRDVTRDAMEAVATEWANRDEPLSYEQYAAIELALGTRIARGFLRAV